MPEIDSFRDVIHPNSSCYPKILLPCSKVYQVTQGRKFYEPTTDRQLRQTPCLLNILLDMGGRSKLQSVLVTPCWGLTHNVNNLLCPWECNLSQPWPPGHVYPHPWDLTSCLTHRAEERCKCPCGPVRTSLQLLLKLKKIVLESTLIIMGKNTFSRTHNIRQHNMDTQIQPIKHVEFGVNKFI